MSLAFRNVKGSPVTPVDEWPYEALVAAVERGTLRDWLPLLRAIEAAPWGPVARQLKTYLDYASPYGVGPLLARTIICARAAAEEQERRIVAERIRGLIAQSGMSQEQFAAAIGTSRSRLSTYASGRVAPAATLLVRMTRVAQQRRKLPRSGTAKSLSAWLNDAGRAQLERKELADVLASIVDTTGGPLSEQELAAARQRLGEAESR